MTREVTELDFRKPEFRHAKVEEYEFRDDGALVRKDRWVCGIRQISSIVGNRGGFEVDDVVEQVRQLAGNWCPPDPEEDPGLDRIDIRLSCGSVLAGCERVGPFAYHWSFGAIDFTSKDFGADVIEWQASPAQPVAKP
ncbi:hypothetical protein [Pseudomonas sp. GM60]|uniref:hypothetical protein n=1 Tax=Pseudomonas sp. GM60 TaxID=1144334 RepID=UPI000270CCFD|nr:hypothetical protein [Pseudomonas sp. GM60]EJM73119.1 hypothetical protein PMI32_05813 [Pseudomonas sp. GM60]